MADLTEEITLLKARIAKYEADLDAATIPEEKKELRGIIKPARETLNKLLDDQKAQPVDVTVGFTTSLGKRDTAKQGSLTKKLIRRCDTKDDARRCEICNVLSAKFETAHLFDLHREAEFEVYYAADRDHLPISINHPENGLLICRNCHGYFDNKPNRLLHIKPDGTIELTGLAKEQNYGNLDGVKVPWADKINQKDWPTSALLQVVYDLKPKSTKRSGTDLDEGVVDTADLPSPKKAAVPKKVKAKSPKEGKALIQEDCC